MPVWVQTLAVNAVSAKNFRDKYGAVFRSKLAVLEANERKTRSRLLADQHIALQALLRYARTHVPHYRDLGCTSDDIHTWPVLDKRAVAEHPERFLSDEFGARRTLTLTTSGTTGTPLRVRVTRDYYQQEMAFRWRHRAWAGVPFPSRSVYLSGHSVVPAGQTEPPFWRAEGVEQRLLCSSYHLSSHNLVHYVEAIRRHRPDFVHGYPSSLQLIARFLLDNGISDVKPKAVFSASETLRTRQRETIEAAFGVKVFNWYGNTEMTCNIVECEAGGLHCRTDYGLLETLDDGTIVCTGLNNRAMPLIRYRVGDVVEMREGNCACGRDFPLVERIVGRNEDYVLTPEGRAVGRLDHLFKDAEHVNEAQIVQTQMGAITIRIVRRAGYSHRVEAAILAEARRRLGTSLDIAFEYRDSLPRTSSGKTRFVVSDLPAALALARDVAPQ